MVIPTLWHWPSNNHGKGLAGGEDIARGSFTSHALDAERGKVMRKRFLVSIGFVLVMAFWTGIAIGQSGGSQGTKQPVHLNPIIDKLAQGKAVLGTATRDFSMSNAHSMARADLDYVRIEMEHSSMSFDTIELFLLGLLDKAGILKQGNARMPIAPIVRLAPYGREVAHWAVKQALDQGVTGIIFPQIDNKEQALSAVSSMRYPQRPGSPYMEPAGMRGYGPNNAVWFWGIQVSEYIKHADLWPLNPEGDLIAIMMIESASGLKNVDQISSVPGVGGLFVGERDLALSIGVVPGSPMIEEASQTILRACKSHNIPCMISVTAADIQKRMNEGWKFLDIFDADGGVTAAIDAAIKVGRAAAQ
jgi:4-hydroxy-2-oxoheptanedioate aldolase